MLFRLFLISRLNYKIIHYYFLASMLRLPRHREFLVLRLTVILALKDMQQRPKVSKAIASTAWCIPFSLRSEVAK